MDGKKDKAHCDEKTYQREKVALALDYAPPIYPCKKCCHPVILGYCCNHCHDTDPSSE